MHLTPLTCFDYPCCPTSPSVPCRPKALFGVHVIMLVQILSWPLTFSDNYLLTHLLLVCNLVLMWS